MSQFQSSQNAGVDESYSFLLAVFFFFHGSRGGVYPPGAAFEKTSIIDGLQKRGVKFEFK
jgi:hypothetical protein